MLGQIVGGISSLFNARTQKRQAEEAFRKAGNWEDYQISEQAKNMLGEAQARRGAQMPGMGIMQAQQAGQQANLLGAASRQAGGGANFMALAAALGAQGQQAGLNMAAQQAQFNEGQQQQLNAARGVMMGEEQRKFQNQLSRFQYFDQMGNQLQQARLANITQGLTSLGQGVTDIFKTAAGAGAFGQGGALQKFFNPFGAGQQTGQQTQQMPNWAQNVDWKNFGR